MGKACLWTAVIVYLIISFVPALALPNLTGLGKGKAKG